ncbi:5'-AMP-activated protein kinase beta subunit, interation domain-containing protein [Daedaleopsis nitida]|nr:5'-AMP-activated protein kinase beta subunit, interation domain-containing protein [Daedaleopsis nitida]
MGNTSSNPHSAPSRLDSPARNNAHSPIRGGSPNPSSASHRVHRSLRNKKKSLELPDLASLTLTPASSSPVSGSPTRPIGALTFRPQNNLPSAARIDRMADGRSRYTKSNLSAFASNRSFQSAIQDSPPRSDAPVKTEFVQEVVHSTIPLALHKADDDSHDPEPVNYKIVWRNGGKKVALIRAGHDNWQGRQPMEFDPQTNTFWAIVPLLPGTHHLKFIVDDKIQLSNDYSKAVDDVDGSLANYVNVIAPFASSSPHQSTLATPLSSPHHAHLNQYNSFWSDSTAIGGSGSHAREADWTTEIPSELIAAAAEEETYLASADSPTSSASGVPAPNIPPAPALPRHLDKLILNVRPPAMAGPVSAASASGDREKRRNGREKSKRERERAKDGGRLGMTSPDGAVDENGAGPSGAAAPPPPLHLPVVTASGTDVTPILAQQQAAGPPTPPAAPHGRPWAGSGISDDASVLPVPSHVVLHHLSTSAIRNGVLAVANTTRYRKKYIQYITTIYYKPT